MMIFKALQRLSLLDFPGKIACIAFAGGCNFRCPFCYNRDLVLESDDLPCITEEDILNYLKSREGWVDGIVVSGGEPTIHTELPEFLEKVKNLGFSVKLDTNGSNPKMLAGLIERRLVDYVALDVKAPLIEESYQAATGTQGRGVVEEVEESIEFLRSKGVDYEFRTTVVPALLTKEDVLLIAERIKGAERYYLQQFKPTDSHIDENYSKLKPYPLEVLQEIQRQIAHHFRVCEVRGAR